MNTKRILIALQMAMMFITLSAQPHFLKKYEQYEDVSITYISKKMIQLCSFAVDVEGLHFSEKLSQIDGLTVLSTPNAELAEQIQQDISLGEYASLMEIKEEHEHVIFYGRSVDDFILELIMLSLTPNECVVTCLSGKFTLNDVLDVIDE